MLQRASKGHRKVWHVWVPPFLWISCRLHFGLCRLHCHTTIFVSSGFIDCAHIPAPTRNTGLWVPLKGEKDSFCTPGFFLLIYLCIYFHATQISLIRHSGMEHVIPSSVRKTCVRMQITMISAKSLASLSWESQSLIISWTVCKVPGSFRRTVKWTTISAKLSAPLHVLHSYKSYITVSQNFLAYLIVLYLVLCWFCVLSPVIIQSSNSTTMTHELHNSCQPQRRRQQP